ncbi:hypothetical protein CTE07_53680 [Chitinophaga terrae (ex Kim and Jung 2007)]|nr:hypothetical protein CTE07_53680 [Chitinophaga terrae (ex Kim and Jung 2007)]
MKGEGNQQDYGMRVYDPRIGRFLSVDPLTKDYSELTPYQFSSNSPIVNIDIDGLEKANSNEQIVQRAFIGGPLLTGLSKSGTQQIAKDGLEVALRNTVKSPVPKPGWAIFSRTNVLLAIWYTFTSPSDEHTPTDLYEKFGKPKNIPNPEQKELIGFDNEMRREGYFRGTPPPDDHEEKKEYFIHYGNRQAMTGIASTMAIFPNKKNKVYLTKAFLTEKEVESIIFLNMHDNEGRGKYMVIFNVDPDQSINIKKAPTDVYEYIYDRGTLKIRPGNLIYIGPNPLRDKNDK